MGSVVTRDEALHRAVLLCHMRLGLGIGANDAELVLRGLPSMALRYHAQDAATRAAAERAIRASVQYAFDHPQASADYVRQHAQEMSAEVCAQHIKLYVNEWSLDVGDEGLRAIQRLVAAGA